MNMREEIEQSEAQRRMTKSRPLLPRRVQTFLDGLAIICSFYIAIMVLFLAFEIVKAIAVILWVIITNPFR